MSKTYYEKLKDPRWQRKRLKILERDDWQCKNCGSSHKTLHVHHKKYNGDPWEVNNEYLETLCEDCHNNEHNKERSLRKNEANQLVIVKTTDFIIEYHESLNKYYHKGPYTILSDVEKAVRLKDEPPKDVFVTSNNTEFHFKLVDIYYSESSIVVNYEFISTIG